MMKVNYKILMYSLSALLAGIFIGFLIIDQRLVFEGLQIGFISWNAVGGLGSIFAACVALFVAFQSWKKAEEARFKDRQQKESDSALRAFLYFRQLSRVAACLASEKFISFKNGNGQAQQRIEEVYDGWKYANTSDDFSSSIIYADNWAGNVNLIDTFEQMLQIAKSSIHSKEEYSITKNEMPVLKALGHSLDVFSSLAHLHAREMLGLTGDPVWIETKKTAQDSLEKLKAIQKEVKEFTNARL